MSNTVEDVPDALHDCISLMPFRTPVIICEGGHTCDLPSIQQWVSAREAHGNEPSCPFCRRPILKNPILNCTVANLMEDHFNLQVGRPPQIPPGEEGQIQTRSTQQNGRFRKFIYVALAVGMLSVLAYKYHLEMKKELTRLNADLARVNEEFREATKALDLETRQKESAAYRKGAKAGFTGGTIVASVATAILVTTDFALTGGMLTAGSLLLGAIGLKRISEKIDRR